MERGEKRRGRGCSREMVITACAHPQTDDARGLVFEPCEPTIARYLFRKEGAYVLASGCRYSHLCLHYYSGNRNEGGTTMNCSRCNGMMVRDRYPATQWADYDALPYYRCVCCGNCEDRLILKHRHAPSEVRTGIQPRMAGEGKR